MRACTCIYTFTRTRMELDHCSDPSATESQKRATRREIYKNDMYIYMWDYGFHQLRLKCDLNAPRCTTTVPQVRLHGSRGGVFVDHRPRGTPVIPCNNKILIK